MWGKFRRRVSKPREEEVVCSSATTVDGDVVDVQLMGFRKLPSFSELPEPASGTSHSDRQDLTVNTESSSNCRCSPLMSFHKHLFGSFMGRQKTSSLQDRNLSEVQKQDQNNGQAMSTAADETELLDCQGTGRSTDSGHLPRSKCEVDIPKTETLWSVQGGLSNSSVNSGVIVSECKKSEDSCEQKPIEPVNPLPPRLMRREKSKGTDVIETRKSRLSSQLKENVCLPAEIVNKSNGRLVVDIACRPPNRLCDTSVQVPYGELDMIHDSSNTDFLHSSAEPSSASSTDSGIQTSLYGSTEDKNHSDTGIQLEYDEDRRYFADNFISSSSAANIKKSCALSQSWQTDRCFNSCNSQKLCPLESEWEHASVNSKILKSANKADYMPVDGSFLMIYQSNSQKPEVLLPKQRQLYACVPKGDRYDDSDKLVENSLYQWQHIDTVTSPPITVSQLKSSCNYVGPAASFSSCRTAETEGIMKDSLIVNSKDADSEDEEYVPPIPSRNYGNSLSRCEDAFVSNFPPEAQNTILADDEDAEQTHMSWAEVIKEAQALGIPLIGPKADEPSNRMSASFTGMEMSDSLDGCLPQLRIHDRMTMSEIGYSNCSDIYNYKRPAAFDRPIPGRRDSPVKGGSPVKNASPFKDKFRLHNLFSKKKNRKSESFDAYDGSQQNCLRRRARPISAVVALDIQRRNLPPLPPAYSLTDGCAVPVEDGIILDHIPASSSSNVSPTHHPQRAVSTIMLPVRDYPSGLSRNTSVSVCNNSTVNFASGSAWNNCSVTIPSNVETSAVGISGSSIASVTSQDPHDVDSPSTTYGEVDAGGDGNNVDFMQSFIKLRDCGWYWGPLGWEEAEMKLTDKPDGSFLVRDSSDDRYILSISFRSQGVTHHTRIEHYKGQFSFYSQPKSHGAASIVDFMERAMAYSRSGQFLYFLRPSAPGLAPAPVQLLHPISRHNTVPSLQHLCRFVIASRVRRDLIDRLPTASSLKEYLKQTQFYAMT